MVDNFKVVVPVHRRQAIEIAAVQLSAVVNKARHVQELLRSDANPGFGRLLDAVVDRCVDAFS